MANHFLSPLQRPDEYSANSGHACRGPDLKNCDEPVLPGSYDNFSVSRIYPPPPLSSLLPRLPAVSTIREPLILLLAPCCIMHYLTLPVDSTNYLLDIGEYACLCS
eukprot:scaffold3666_cov268-Chaetoceros_neogracile.AAC.9